MRCRRRKLPRCSSDRAKAVRHSYDDGDEREHIAAICADLDGLPLAIELAAARMRVLSAKQLRARLATRFELLTTAPRDTSARHATLRAALDWSWELLDEAERAALTQCSVFEGGFTVDAAEAVLRLDQKDAPAIIDALQALRDKSLLRIDSAAESGIRFSLFMSIRDYAREKLDADGGAQAARDRHAEHYLVQGLMAAAHSEGSRSREARAYIHAERDNLLSVHRRALIDPVDPERALRAAVVIQPVLITGGPAALRLSILESALSVLPKEPSRAVSQLSGYALLARADCLLGLGQLDEARADLKRAIEIAHEHDDGRLSGRCEWRLGTARWVGGAIDQAWTHVERATEIFRDAGDERHVGRCLGSLGLLCWAKGELVEARDLYEQALRIHRAKSDRRWIAATTARVAMVDATEGKLDDAERRFHDAIAQLKEGQNQRHLAQMLVSMGALTLERGDAEKADAYFVEALALQTRVPDRRAEVSCLLEHSDCLLRLDRPEEAASSIDQALDVTRGLGNKQLEAIALCRKGRMTGDAALIELAAKTSSDPLASAMVLLARGHMALSRDDREGARSAIDAVELIAERHALVRRESARLLRALDDEPPDDALVVSGSGEWFKPSGGERVDLKNRRSLRLVLRALIRHRFDHPGETLTTHALFEAGWPGERAQPQAATSRVYVALSTLRKLGLRDVVVKKESGYLIDEGIDLRRW